MYVCIWYNYFVPGPYNLQRSCFLTATRLWVCRHSSQLPIAALPVASETLNNRLGGMHTYIHTYIHTLRRICIERYLDASTFYLQSVRVSWHTYIHTHIHTYIYRYKNILLFQTISTWKLHFCKDRYVHCRWWKRRHFALRRWEWWQCALRGNNYNDRNIFISLLHGRHNKTPLWCTITIQLYIHTCMHTYIHSNMSRIA
jgi:hypothetical protein